MQHQKVDLNTKDAIELNSNCSGAKEKSETEIEKSVLNSGQAAEAESREQQPASKKREQLFDALWLMFKESLRQKWEREKLIKQPQVNRLFRLVRATFEQRRNYPNEWRTQFVRRVRTLHSMTGYRDVRALLFEWLRKYGQIPLDADPFIYADSRIRRHLARLENIKALSLNDQYLLPSAPPENSKQIVITIDNPETTDRDDALSFRCLDHGYEIGVHVPILDQLVPKDGQLDQWAGEFSISIYMPHLVVPMLPNEWVSQYVSLNEGKVRNVLSFYFIKQENHKIKFDRACCESIKIDYNTHYDQVENWLTQASSEFDQNELTQSDSSSTMQAQRELPKELIQPLKAWLATSEELEKRRLEMGGRRFDREHIDVIAESSGEIWLRKSKQDSPAHKLVSEWMIAANQAGGSFCHEHDIPCIYRVQEAASPKEKESDLDGIGSFVPSQSSLKRGAHHDLGIEGYTQITSPLRRYIDLLMQRQVVSFLESRTPSYSATELLQRAEALEESNRRLQKIASKAAFYYKCVFLSQHIGESFEAAICQSPPPAKTVVLTLTGLALRLFVPLSCIDGLNARGIPPHNQPMQVKALCVEMDPDRGMMLFRVKRKP